MLTSIVFTFIGADRPGLVERLTTAVSRAGGNWLHSSMSQLGGYFAGSCEVQIAADKAAALRNDLQRLSGADLTIVVPEPLTASADSGQQYHLSIIGNDRPGILREVAAALASRRINVCEMSTQITSAPMSADLLFEAVATIAVPAGQDIDELCDTMDAIANELTVDIRVEA